MKFNVKCTVCRKKRLFIKKWYYSHESLPSGGLTSDVAVCWICHKNTQALNLGKWSIRHYYHFAQVFLGLVRKSGKQAIPLKGELKRQIPPTLLGWITQLYIIINYIMIK